MTRILHASIVGSLIYATIFIRPDITYDVGLVSRYQSDPNLVHW